jgi:hypothetical protein
MSKVALRIHFTVPSNNVDIVRHIAEFPRLSEISRHKSEENGDREAEPEVRGGEKEVIVAVSISREPTRRNDGIDRLEQMLVYLVIYEQDAVLPCKPTQVQYQ